MSPIIIYKQSFVKTWFIFVLSTCM